MRQVGITSRSKDKRGSGGAGASSEGNVKEQRKVACK